jgi:hypothetical protein
MRNTWTPSPWVEQHRDGVSFALQVSPIDTNEFASLGLPFLPARERQAALAEAIAASESTGHDRRQW